MVVTERWVAPPNFYDEPEALYGGVRPVEVDRTVTEAREQILVQCAGYARDTGFSRLSPGVFALGNGRLGRRTHELVMEFVLGPGAIFNWPGNNWPGNIDDLNSGHGLIEFTAYNDGAEPRQIVIGRRPDGILEFPRQDFTAIFCRPDGSVYVIANGVHNELEADYYPQRDADRRRLKELARTRSLQLLYDWLTPQQRDDFKLYGYFIVRGGNTGRSYRIRRSCNFNVDQLDAHGVEQTLCFVPKKMDLPEGDFFLTQKLALEHDETATLRIANRQSDMMPLATPGASCVDPGHGHGVGAAGYGGGDPLGF